MSDTAYDAANTAFWEAFDDRADHEPFTDAITAAADAVVGRRDAVLANWLRNRADRFARGEAGWEALIGAAEKLEKGEVMS